MKHELTQEEILVEIKDILSEYIEITRPLTPADRLIDDLGLDSFLIVYFITEIEDCFEIDIPETDFIEFVTVKDLCERIQLEIIPACHRQVIINSFCKQNLVQTQIFYIQDIKSIC